MQRLKSWIQAAGIADYQATISNGLADKILSWQGIEATEKAESPNAKFVPIRSGKARLPVIPNSTSIQVANNTPGQ